MRSAWRYRHNGTQDQHRSVEKDRHIHLDFPLLRGWVLSPKLAQADRSLRNPRSSEGSTTGRVSGKGTPTEHSGPIEDPFGIPSGPRSHIIPRPQNSASALGPQVALKSRKAPSYMGTGMGTGMVSHPNPGTRPSWLAGSDASCLLIHKAYITAPHSNERTSKQRCRPAETTNQRTPAQACYASSARTRKPS